MYNIFCITFPCTIIPVQPCSLTANYFRVQRFLYTNFQHNTSCTIFSFRTTLVQHLLHNIFTYIIFLYNTFRTIFICAFFSSTTFSCTVVSIQHFRTTFPVQHFLYNILCTAVSCTAFPCLVSSVQSCLVHHLSTQHSLYIFLY